jgi:hypothetical protein
MSVSPKPEGVGTQQAFCCGRGCVFSCPGPAYRPCSERGLHSPRVMDGPRGWPMVTSTPLTRVDLVLEDLERSVVPTTGIVTSITGKTVAASRSKPKPVVNPAWFSLGFSSERLHRLLSKQQRCWG